MEERERFVIEVFLGLILIVFLILLVFLVLGVSKSNTKETQTPVEVIDSYNANYYNSYDSPRVERNFNRVSYRDYDDRVYYRDLGYDSDYDFDDDFDEEEYLDYDQAGRLRKTEGFFGNDIDAYEVYVRNEEYTGGNFEVTFYFKDHYGRVSRASEMKYIPAREERKFFYKDVSPGYEVKSWRYDVKSLTEVPERDYDDERRYTYYRGTPTVKYYYPN